MSEADGTADDQDDGGETTNTLTHVESFQGSVSAHRLGGPVSFSPADVWPLIRTDLERSVVARGLDHASAEDIAQETYIRAVLSGARFPSVRAARRWTWKVAKFLSIDELRRRRRLEVVADLPERPEPYEPDELVEARQRWRLFLSRVATLPAAERAAVVDWLFEPPVEGASKREQDRDALRRLRARDRLRRLGEGFAVVAWRFRARFGQVFSEGYLASVAVLGLAALSMSGAPPPPPPSSTTTTASQPATAGSVTPNPPKEAELVQPATGAVELPRSVRPRTDGPAGSPPPVMTRPTLASVADPLGTHHAGTEPNTAEKPMLCASAVGLDFGCFPKPRL